MADLRRVVLDVLMPHEPSLLTLTNRIADVESVEGTNASLVELDREVRNLQLTVEGTALDYGAIEEEITDIGGTVHSVDQAACGEYTVDDHRTVQDD